MVMSPPSAMKAVAIMRRSRALQPTSVNSCRPLSMPSTAMHSFVITGLTRSAMPFVPILRPA
jgi:hypothetical protein